MTASLAGCGRRLEWAAQQLHTLNQEIDGFLDRESYGVRGEADTKLAQCVFRAHLPAKPPPQFGLLASDILHNLRATLDNLAYQLSILGSGADPPPDPSKIEFPIFVDASKFTAKRQRDSIGHVRPDVQALIQSMQPYTTGGIANSHILWLLHELNNIDKHRLLHVPMFLLRNILIVPHPRNGMALLGEYTTGAMEDGTEVARFLMFKPNVQMKVYSGFDISIQERSPANLPVGLRDTSAMFILSQAWERVFMTVVMFEPLFQEHIRGLRPFWWDNPSIHTATYWPFPDK